MNIFMCESEVCMGVSMHTNGVLCMSMCVCVCA